MTDSRPTFDIPVRPERRFPRDGGIEYDGETSFHVTPRPEQSESDLVSLVEGILDDEPYTYGDWFDLPAPVYLVRDRAVETAFRVVVRHGRIELQVLPDTDADGLRSFYDRLPHDEIDWSVECETDG